MKFNLHSTYRLMLLFHSYLYCLNCVLSLWFAVPCFALALLWCVWQGHVLTYTRPAAVIRLHVDSQTSTKAVELVFYTLLVAEMSL